MTPCDPPTLAAPDITSNRSGRKGKFSLISSAQTPAMTTAKPTPVIAINRHIGVARIYLLLSAVLLPCVWAAAAGGLPAIAAVLVVLELVFFATVLRAAWQVTGDSGAQWLRAVLGPGGGGVR